MTNSVYKYSILLFLIYSEVTLANGADVLACDVKCDNNFCRFDVTVSHADTGWEHYANSIEILNADKTKVLGVRKLHHPHVNEQPFTRSASVLFEQAIDKVIIRAHDSVHGFSGKELEVTMPDFNP